MKERHMRKIISGLYSSLDGVIEAPETWHFPYNDAAMQQARQDFMANVDTVLFGRTTYEAFAGYWPTQGDDMPFASYINNIPKIVVSTTLGTAEWNNTTLITSEVVPSIKALKETDGKEISVSGSPTLVRTLLREGL